MPQLPFRLSPLKTPHPPVLCRLASGSDGRQNCLRLFAWGAIDGELEGRQNCLRLFAWGVMDDELEGWQNNKWLYFIVKAL